MVIGSDTAVTTPLAFRAITWIEYVRRNSTGTFGTRYVSVKTPTPVFVKAWPYPTILASTLATFEEVITVPETVSPGAATLRLSDALIILGAASGAAVATTAGGATGGLGEIDTFGVGVAVAGLEAVGFFSGSTRTAGAWLGKIRAGATGTGRCGPYQNRPATAATAATTTSATTQRRIRMRAEWIACSTISCVSGLQAKVQETSNKRVHVRCARRNDRTLRCRARI